jgi:hypothetical protein
MDESSHVTAFVPAGESGGADDGTSDTADALAVAMRFSSHATPEDLR